MPKRRNQRTLRNQRGGGFFGLFDGPKAQAVSGRLGRAARSVKRKAQGITAQVANKRPGLTEGSPDFLKWIGSAYMAGVESKKQLGGGKKKKKKNSKKKKHSKKKNKSIKSGATIYANHDIVVITNIIDSIIENWYNNDEHHKHKMELKRYLKTELDPAFTDEQIDKLIHRIAFFKENNTVNDNTTDPIIRNWIDAARGIYSRSKKKKSKKRKKKSKKKNLRSSKIKKLRKKIR